MAAVIVRKICAQEVVNKVAVTRCVLPKTWESAAESPRNSGLVSDKQTIVARTADAATPI